MPKNKLTLSTKKEPTKEPTKEMKQNKTLKICKKDDNMNNWVILKNNLAKRILNQ